MKRALFSSLRSRLMLLAVIAVLPALGLILIIAAEQQRLAPNDPAAARVLGRYLLGVALIFLLALGAAWLGGEFFILRRVRSLLHATRRLEAGDWSARTGLPYGQGELSQLAQAFDNMTQALEQREIERTQEEYEAERHYRDLVALNVSLTAISASLELPEILESLKKQLAEQLDVPGGIIFFFDEIEDSLYLEAAWGIPAAVLAELKRFPASSFHYKEAIRERLSILRPDFRKVAPYAGSGLAAARPEWQSYLCVPLLAKDEIQGVLDLFSKAPADFNPSQVVLFNSLGRQVGVIIQNARLFAQVRAGQQRLQMLSQQLLEVQEAERRHLARELHDEIGQSLTALKVNLQSVMRLSGGLSAASLIEDSISITERVLQQVRNLSLDLRPSLLDDLGVVSALRWYIDRQGRRAGFQTEFIADPPDLRLPPEMETVCFRVVQEALTNVVRHALASQVQVHLARQANRVELVIRDNGIGFDVQAVRGRAPTDSSLGLLGMQERVQLIGGQIEIRSDPEQGTEIRATFPLAAAL
ncbi:MAG TPA: ATP-binding protein [Anaerolineales bacterium]